MKVQGLYGNSGWVEYTERRMEKLHWQLRASVGQNEPKTLRNKLGLTAVALGIGSISGYYQTVSKYEVLFWGGSRLTENSLCPDDTQTMKPVQISPGLDTT